MTNRDKPTNRLITVNQSTGEIVRVLQEVKPLKALYPIVKRDILSNIPPHPSYHCPVARWLYLDGKGMVVAQGIEFDAVEQEQYLILARTNGGKRWVWAQVVPEHEKRVLYWKLC